MEGGHPAAPSFQGGKKCWGMWCSPWSRHRAKPLEHFPALDVPPVGPSPTLNEGQPRVPAKGRTSLSFPTLQDMQGTDVWVSEPAHFLPAHGLSS